MTDASDQRAELISRWERGASGWGERADGLRDYGMPVSEWLIDALSPQPGQRLLELAAGPGDTGFMAAELIKPGGTLISSDAAEAMLDLARSRAERFGIDNVEFKRLQLEWIDLDTASVDGVLCRWGVMLVVDPAAALQEMRRVLKPGGRAALAVWDRPDLNAWATIPSRALIELGHAEPPDPSAPGMFALAPPGRLAELLESAGFSDVTIHGVDVQRVNSNQDAFVAETLDLARPFAEIYEQLGPGERAAVLKAIGEGLGPFTMADGSVSIPGRVLVAAASA